MGGFQVRGGTPNQNLVLLDDAPIINSGHIFGFIYRANSFFIGGCDMSYGNI